MKSPKNKPYKDTGFQWSPTQTHGKTAAVQQWHTAKLFAFIVLLLYSELLLAILGTCVMQLKKTQSTEREVK